MEGERENMRGEGEKGKGGRERELEI
jgi:hypothetical protein